MTVLLLRVALFLDSAAHLEPAALVVGAVRARHKLLVLALEGEPCLQVVLHRRRVVQRTGHDGHNTVGNLQALVELLRVRDHLVEHLPGARGVRDAELLDLLKLVHTENAPGVLAVRAGLLAEARRVAGVADRQLLRGLVEPLVRVERRDGLLRRGNEVLVVLVARDLVQFLVKVLELRRLGHMLLAHHERRHDLFVRLLAEEVEAVVDQRLVQVYTVARQVETTVPGNLRATVRVEELETVHHFVVRQDVILLLDLRVRAVGVPRLDDEVVVLRLRHRHLVADEVTDRTGLGAHHALCLRHMRLELGDLGIELLLLRELFVGALLVFLLGRDGLLGCIDLLLQVVQLELERDPVLVVRQHLFHELNRGATLALRLAHHLRVAALLDLELLQVNHRGSRQVTWRNVFSYLPA